MLQRSRKLILKLSTIFVLLLSTCHAFTQPKNTQQSLVFTSTTNTKPNNFGTSTTTIRNHHRQDDNRYHHDQTKLMRLNHHQDVVIDGPLDAILHQPIVWSSLTMFAIVGLLLIWEETVHNLRHSLPKALLPVVDSMLAEMGGLGFIGLVLSIFVTGGLTGQVLEEISEKYLGGEENLLETFEFLHSAFFEVGIGFFLVAGLTVYAVLNQCKQLSEISELALDTDGDGEVSIDELADALQVQSLVVDADGDGQITEDEITDALRQTQKSKILDQLTLSKKESGAELLVIREGLLEKFKLPQSFQIERYFEQIFGQELKDIVKLSPVTWLPLIPLIGLVNSVDLDHGIVSASSPNSFETCGDFFATPLVLYPSIASETLAVVWGLYNFWKMSSIKDMLIPTLVRDGGENGPAVLLPPRYMDRRLRRTFQVAATPIWARPIESYYSKPATNDHERLFGTAGQAGPALFLNSIKFQSWLMVSQVIFFGSQIVSRDIAAMLTPVALVGNPETLVAETLLFGSFVAINVALLVYLSPKTFLNYCFVTSIECLTKDYAMDVAVEESEIEARRAEKAAAAEKSFLETNHKTASAIEPSVTMVTSEVKESNKEPEQATDAQEENPLNGASDANGAREAQIRSKFDFRRKMKKKLKSLIAN